MKESFFELNKIIKQLKAKSTDKREQALFDLAMYEGIQPAEDAIKIQALKNVLRDRNFIIRSQAADFLDQLGWKGTPQDLAYYYVAKKDFEEAASLGELALPALMNALDDDASSISAQAFYCLRNIQFNPDTLSPQDQALYYLLSNQWNKLPQVGIQAIPALIRSINQQDKQSSWKAIKVLEDMRLQEADIALAKLIGKNLDYYINQNIAKALEQSSTPQIFTYLTSKRSVSHITPESCPKLNACLICHPEWIKKPPESADLIKFHQAILNLPPIGGKIYKFRPRPLFLDIKLYPTLSATQQMNHIIDLRKKGKLTPLYVHQLSVQGRLPDKFKLSAIALIISSPYKCNWEQPFYEAPWGKVAPLVHDGGNVNYGINPRWQMITGRTDYITRIAQVFEPSLETIENLPLAEKSQLPYDQLIKAKAESLEKDRLNLETKAYQSLALSCHASLRQAPKEIPRSTRGNLADLWDDYENKLLRILQEYDVQRVTQVPWFVEQARLLPNWSDKRLEAPYPPIKEELIKLEDVKINYPQIRPTVINLLKSITNLVYQEIGLTSPSI